jgi:hypothetical protein
MVCEWQIVILNGIVICVTWNDTWRESDEVDEDATNNGSVKRQVKLSSLGFTGFKRKTEEIESSGKGRCKFFQARKLELVRKFQWCVQLGSWWCLLIERLGLNTLQVESIRLKLWHSAGPANAGLVFVMCCKELVGIVVRTLLRCESGRLNQHGGIVML